jgi:protein-tyrosine phosphatase
MKDATTRVLFVCLGNICRSPLAEGVFRHLARQRGVANHYHADSAGTGGWHIGEDPDHRSTEVARRNGVLLEGAARQVVPEDFERFDRIVAMDRANLRDLKAMRRQGGRAELHLLRDFDPEPGDRDVPDPYYGGPEGFDDVYAMVRRSAEALLERLEQERERRGEGPARAGRGPRGP